MKDYGLGRLPAIDARDQKYLIRSALPTLESAKTSKYYWSNGWWGDQDQTPQCVAYGFIHLLEDGAITHKKVPPPMFNPEEFYLECQDNDEWDGNNYDGTSVRAAMKVGQKRGVISEYKWAFDQATMLYTVLEISPVLIGVNWYTHMFMPESDGIIKIGGIVEGGHCVVINGANKKTGYYRGKNSWGKEWAKGGYFYISFDDMERLIGEGGEVALPIEIPDAK